MSVSIVKPVVGADNGVWGTELNTVLDALNAADYFRVKTADQSITSSTTLTDDAVLAGLALPVGTFVVVASYMVSGAAAGDVKVAWSFSGTAANSWRGGQGPTINTTDATGAGAAATTVGVSREAASGGTTAGITNATPYGTDGTNVGLIQETGVLVVTVAGALKVQWAQNASSATATIMRAGSWLWARQVA